MPLYTYENPKTGEKIDILQGMKDVHRFHKDGLEWKRVFAIPQASFDTKIDPFSPKQFTERTGKKAGTLGDLFDYSKEQSIKREQIAGRDDVKVKHFENYSKRRKGKEHPIVRKEKLTKEFSKMGFEVSD